MYSDPEHPRQLPEQKQRRDAEEAPVEAVDHPAVRPERAPEILDPAPPLDRARGEVAHGTQHAHEQALLARPPVRARHIQRTTHSEPERVAADALVGRQRGKRPRRDAAQAQHAPADELRGVRDQNRGHLRAKGMQEDAAVSDRIARAKKEKL